jgi:hypothetical protein
VGESHAPLVHVATPEAVPVLHEKVNVVPDAVPAPSATAFVVVKSELHAAASAPVAAPVAAGSGSTLPLPADSPASLPAGLSWPPAPAEP